MKVFVAGPYTRGDTAANVRQAICAANQLFDLGYIPFVPHLMHFWHYVYPRAYEDWTTYDNEWLPLCHVVFRLSGESPGADDEMKLAESLDIPVVHSITELEDLRQRWELSNAPAF